IVSCRRARLLLAAFSLAALLRAQEPAVDPDAPAAPTAEQAEFDALVARLVAPLQPDLVRAAVHHPRIADAGAAQGLATHLTAQGGAAAAAGLFDLANHVDPEVRVAALRGLATVGLRVPGAAEAARTALRDFAPEVRLAAIAALGALGGGEDVGALL